MSLEQAILEKVRALPPEKQQEILDFAEFLQVKLQQNPDATEVVKGKQAESTEQRPRLSMGERLIAIRQQAIENGMQPLTVGEVEQEIADQRDRQSGLWVD